MATRELTAPPGQSPALVVRILGWIRTCDRSSLLRPDVLTRLAPEHGLCVSLLALLVYPCVGTSQPFVIPLAIASIAGFGVRLP